MTRNSKDEKLNFTSLLKAKTDRDKSKESNSDKCGL